MHTLEQVRTIADQTDGLFKTQINKSKLVVEEYERQEVSLQEIVDAQQQTIKRLEEDSNAALSEKAAQDAIFEEQKRQLKEAFEKTQAATSLSELELSNLKSSNDLILNERKQRLIAI